MMISLLIMVNVLFMGLSMWKRVPLNTVYYATDDGGGKTNALIDYQYIDYEQMLAFVNDIFTWYVIFKILMTVPTAPPALVVYAGGWAHPSTSTYCRSPLLLIMSPHPPPRLP